MPSNASSRRRPHFGAARVLTHRRESEGPGLSWGLRDARGSLATAHVRPQSSRAGTNTPIRDHLTGRTTLQTPPRLSTCRPDSGLPAAAATVLFPVVSAPLLPPASQLDGEGRIQNTESNTESSKNSKKAKLNRDSFRTIPTVTASIWFSTYLVYFGQQAKIRNEKGEIK